jgi:hypothetical protein
MRQDSGREEFVDWCVSAVDAGESTAAESCAGITMVLSALVGRLYLHCVVDDQQGCSHVPACFGGRSSFAGSIASSWQSYYKQLLLSPCFPASIDHG